MEYPCHIGYPWSSSPAKLRTKRPALPTFITLILLPMGTRSLFYQKNDGTTVTSSTKMRKHPEYNAREVTVHCTAWPVLVLRQERFSDSYTGIAAIDSCPETHPLTPLKLVPDITTDAMRPEHAILLKPPPQGSMHSRTSKLLRQMMSTQYSPIPYRRFRLANKSPTYYAVYVDTGKHPKVPRERGRNKFSADSGVMWPIAPHRNLEEGRNLFLF